MIRFPLPLPRIISWYLIPLSLVPHRNLLHTNTGFFPPHLKLVRWSNQPCIPPYGSSCTLCVFECIGLLPFPEVFYVSTDESKAQSVSSEHHISRTTDGLFHLALHNYMGWCGLMVIIGSNSQNQYVIFKFHLSTGNAQYLSLFHLPICLPLE